MNKERLIYAIMCGVGGCLIGVFAGKVDTLLGGALFTFGVFLLTFSTIRLSK